VCKPWVAFGVSASSSTEQPTNLAKRSRTGSSSRSCSRHTTRLGSALARLPSASSANRTARGAGESPAWLNDTCSAGSNNARNSRQKASSSGRAAVKSRRRSSAAVSSRQANSAGATSRERRETDIW
jgi:hypothetical protein